MQAEPHQSDVGTLSRSHRPDLVHVDLARDHLVPEAGHDLGKQLEPLPLLVRDQDAQVPGLSLSYVSKISAVQVASAADADGALVLPLRRLNTGAAVRLAGPEAIRPAKDAPSVEHAGAAG